MSEKVEINTETLEKIFKMAGLEVPDEISDENLMAAVSKIKNPKPVQSRNNALNDIENIDGESDAEGNSSKSILVIDDIGVVTYQLKVLLQNLGYNVKVAKDIFNGINSFIHSTFAYVVMDLFVSTEQEGYTLLNETKKIITQNNLSTKIIVITASSRAENRVRCINGGADYFIKKDVGWQDKLIALIEKSEAEQQQM